MAQAVLLHTSLWLKMQKGSILYTVIFAALTCKALPQYGNSNQVQSFNEEGLLQNIKENQQQSALPSSQHIQSTDHASQSTPQQQSQHLPGHNSAQQAQQATESLGHHNGDNFTSVGHFNPNQQSQHLPCQNKTQQAQKATQSFGHHNGDNFTPVGQFKPNLQSQHLQGHTIPQQAQKTAQSLGHQNGDNLSPIGGFIAGLQCGLANSECVPYFQCVDGYINTDGAGLLDARDLPKSTCSHPDYPEISAVCCQTPESSNPSENHPPVTNVQTQTPITSRDVCPLGSACLPDALCLGEVVDETGNIVSFTPGGVYTRCIIGDEFTSPGVCCRNPLPTHTQLDTTTSMSILQITHLPTTSQCGIRQNSIPEIPAQRIMSNVAYNEAQFGEFPWQAIIFLSNYTFKCGASIIGDRWLLTAAHCVDGFKANDFNIRVGEWQVNTFDEQYPYYDAPVGAITVHPDFNARNVHNDIAVIELVETLSPQYHINSICLPAPSQTFSGQRCVSTGWGKDSFNGQYQSIMKKVELPLVEHQQCQELLRKTRLGRYFNLDNSFMCAGGEENEDACKGDGGGPLACQDPISGNYVLTGITAWGISCGKKNIPGVYVDVQTFVPWVEAVIAGTYDVKSINDHSTNEQSILQSLHSKQNQNQTQLENQTQNSDQEKLMANNQVNNVASY